MKLQLISVGTRPPDWLRIGFEEYNKRLPGKHRIHLHEVPVARRTSSRSVTQLIDKEGEQIMALVQKEMRVIALDRKGENWSTEKMVEMMQSWQMDGRNLAFIIGGPDGLSSACEQRADHCWSLSSLTFPHFLVRVMVAEQVYRCWTLMNNHPYHK